MSYTYVWFNCRIDKVFFNYSGVISHLNYYFWFLFNSLIFKRFFFTLGKFSKSTPLLEAQCFLDIEPRASQC